MQLKAFSKRLSALEVRHAPAVNRWSHDCDLKRRLAKYRAQLENRSWVCTGDPERKAQNEARLVRYKRYFDELEAGVGAPEWL